MLNKLIALILLFFLTSCYTESFERLLQKEGRMRSVKGYNSFLALEYADYAKYLHYIRQNEIADYFSQKSLNAFDGAYLTPEIPQNWNFPASKLDEVIFAGKRLQAINNFKTKILLPTQLAHLILLYDCWVVSRGNNFNGFIANSTCKSRFYLLLDEMEELIKKSKESKPKEPKKELDLTEFTLYFDLNSYKLNNNAMDELKSSLEFLNNYDSIYSILLVGSSDASGRKIYNKYLSNKRILTVKNYLIKNGVPKHVITHKSFGEEKPALITQEKKQNIHNRYVKIYISREENINKIPLPIIEQKIYYDKIKSKKLKLLSH